MSDADLDRDVRVALYRSIERRADVPRAAALAGEMGLPPEDVRASFARLGAGRVVVLASDGEILMANPYSAAPTAFPVRARGKWYFGNCVWDALGILAILASDGVVEATCGDGCGPLTLEVRGGEVRGEGVVHFAVPARDWWKDIVFT